jgi:predicted transcriptional regulator
MATTTVKATYSLDEETARTLERLARRHGVSKSEVLRHAIHHLARHDVPRGEAALSALDDLQRRLQLTATEAEEWEARLREERRAAPRR